LAHALNAVAVETGRGWRLAKEKASRKIDGIVALSFACLDAVERAPVKPTRTYVPQGRFPTQLDRGGVGDYRPALRRHVGIFGAVSNPPNSSKGCS
jgi:hypothetical protein